MSITIYGIKNCSTMKKAFDWLEGRHIAHHFHDYKREGIDTATLQRWCTALGWEVLVNTRGTTWRNLSPAEQAIARDADAIALMQRYPSLIKRPVLERDALLLVGFSIDAWEKALAD
jgi:Spx/MgsR family transcriptional regulator